MRLKIVGAGFVLLSALATRDLQSQASTFCRAANDSSYDVTEMIKQYALATEPEWTAPRDSLGIPAVASAADIQLVTKEATCKSGNTAYQAVATGARQTLSGRVFVLQVGAVLVVWDPAYRFDTSHNKDVFMVFTSRWEVKSIF